MPRRDDIKSILIFGSGPIIIGQACEFDYSGTQACKILKEKGYRIILVNSNPATMMTDPELADSTYIEPLTLETAKEIIKKEKPDALLPTVGGQTALNLSLELHHEGTLKEWGVEVLGASIEAIQRAESRKEFKSIVNSINLQMPNSLFCNSVEQAVEFMSQNELPLVIRPSFTLGGSGGGIARTKQDLEEIVLHGLRVSPTNEVLIEESVLGWKEFELEVMRDSEDNAVVICSIENLDPMGVHTGDSITVAPQQTLSDSQYQKMRNASLSIIRAVGVATGGSNIQFAVNPMNGDMTVIEMNPRVSRSSALASKATGFPIARIAAQLAVGYTLHELRNDITKTTPASFEPALDYVITKIPRFTFEKFPDSDDTLGTSMHSVGESMGIGRTFKESLQKAIRSLETSRLGLGDDGNLAELFQHYKLRQKSNKAYYTYLEESLARPNPGRIFDIKTALKAGIEEPESGFTMEKVYEISRVDPWFLHQILEIIALGNEYQSLEDSNHSHIVHRLKANGFSDRQIAFLQEEKAVQEILSKTDIEEHIQRQFILKILNEAENRVFQFRLKENIIPVYKRVDTCAGEFESWTPYLYSSYEEEDESEITKRKKILILGGGPNRIGQGIEFDYCCCHASFALQEMDIESIMVNCNPETVSTDFDISDKLYFEPLTFEDVMNICHREKPDGIVVSFGGQTPLSLVHRLEEAGLPILGNSASSIEQTEDRKEFSLLLQNLDIKQPLGGTARTFEEAEEIIKGIGYPVLIRPSYVLGGRAMAIVYKPEQLMGFVQTAASISPEYHFLIDRFLENAVEVDVDALADGDEVYIAGIMQHIEEAGIHSGDSACILPPLDLSKKIIEEIKDSVKKIALKLKIVGLVNIQFAVSNEELFVIEVNPRASRTVPFVSKVLGISIARIAIKLMCGQKLKDMKLSSHLIPEDITAVKEAVLPFIRFPGSDTILGPEMKSTGEVMGIAESAGQAFLKAQLGAGEKLSLVPNDGIFLSVNNSVKPQILKESRHLEELGFDIYATEGTANFLTANGIKVQTLHKMKQRQSPNPMELIHDGKIKLVINMPDSSRTRDDAFVIRQEAVRQRVLCITTVAALKILLKGLMETKDRALSVDSLQNIHRRKSLS